MALVAERPGELWRRTSGIGGNWKAWILCLLCLSALVPRPAQAQAPASKEYQVKAAFLFNFAQFIEWPATAFTNVSAPVCIGVLGENSFGTALEQTVQGETIQGRKLVVRHARQIADLRDCQVIFISKSEKVRNPEILASLDSRPVLTVSEVDGFARRGGVINFYLEGPKVRFEINPAVAKQSGLKVSSELLNLGKITESEPREGGR